MFSQPPWVVLLCNQAENLWARAPPVRGVSGGRGVGGHVLPGLGWRASQEAFRGACMGHISSKAPWLLAPLPRAPDSTWEQVVGLVGELK